MLAVGIDGCKKGWIAVAWATDGSVQAEYLPTIADLERLFPDIGAVAIDIPIGLPERSRRQADSAAKALLGRLHSSVFFVPPRSALQASDHATGTAISTALTGFGMSQQAYAMRTKIFETEDWMSATPFSVWEAHPEVSFTHLLGHSPAASKSTWSGMVERREALLKIGIDVDVLTGPAGSKAAVDDMLDAAVCAWTARRIATSEAVSYPNPPEPGTGGRAMTIWA